MNTDLPNQRNKPSTLVGILRQRALEQPEKRAYTFLVDGETEETVFTNRELDQRARAIGAQLQSMGAAGERALLLYPPGLDYIAALFGCLYGGVVAVPAYPPDIVRLRRTLPRFRAIANDARPLVVMTVSLILSMAEALFTHDPDFQAMRWLSTDNIASDLAEEWWEPEISRDKLALLQYTSGSTADPKGAMLTHGNLMHNSELMHQAFETGPDTRTMSWLPFYHDMGLVGGILQALYCGGTSVLMSPLHFLQRPLRWLQAISRGRATHSGGPNFAYDLCVRKISPEQRATLDLSSWEMAVNGAEPVRYETLEHFTAAFAPCGFRREAFYPGYGLAEATLVVTGGLKKEPPIVYSVNADALAQDRVVAAAPEDETAQILVGCGRTWLGQKVVIVDPESSTICAPDQIGEIWVSGSSVAQGYWNRPKETEQIFGAQLVDTGEGPFLRTGDLGFMKDGELFITGRLKDLIIIDGLNHYPQDIELSVEQSHLAVRPGCSAAFSVEVRGRERLVVVAEVRPDKAEAAGVSEVTGAIRRAVSEAHDLRVHAVVLLKPRTIPKTSSGKIQRRACRASFLAETLDVWES